MSGGGEVEPGADHTGESVGVVRRELDAAYEQLQASNEALATANDELRSTIGELESTNRELVAANEELEALTQELHATNDEIAAISEELRRRSDEVDEVNAYLSSVLDALDHAVVAVDADLKVRTWNRRAQQRWGRSRQEVLRRQIGGLDLDLPMDELLVSIRTLLDGGTDEPCFELEAVDGDAGSSRCAVRLSALRSGDDVTGAMIVVTASATADAGR